MSLKDTVAVIALAFPVAAQPPQTVPWDGISRIIEEGRSDRAREYVVTTKDGATMKARELWLSATGIQAQRRWPAGQPDPYGPEIPRNQVSEIRIRHRGRLSYFGWVLKKLLGEPDGWDLFNPMPLILSPLDLAFGAVATPPMLPIEAVRRIRSTKVIYKAVP